MIPDIAIGFIAGLITGIAAIFLLGLLFIRSIVRKTVLAQRQQVRITRIRNTEKDY